MQKKKSQQEILLEKFLEKESNIERSFKKLEEIILESKETTVEKYNILLFATAQYMLHNHKPACKLAYQVFLVKPWNNSCLANKIKEKIRDLSLLLLPYVEPTLPKVPKPVKQKRQSSTVSVFQLSLL